MFSQKRRLDEVQSLSLNDWSNAPLPSYTPSDSTDAPAFPSPVGAASWGHDGFSHDPGFLASQEELRCMLFNIAQSAAPTRAPSPETQDAAHLHDPKPTPTRPVLSSPRRVEYLKNYVGQVAPWVIDIVLSQTKIANESPSWICSIRNAPSEYKFPHSPDRSPH
jgi:hypothetical protein